MKWLNIADLDVVKPDPARSSADLTINSRKDFSSEAEAFISSIFLEYRNVMDLLTADYTFLNDRLARHYGISGVIGTQFRKVILTDKERDGLLGKAAILLADLIWGSHFAGVARSVGARQTAGHASDASSAKYGNRPFC